MSGTIIKNREFEKPANILIIDDLCGTGATLNEATKVLKRDGNVKNIYVLVITKTKGC
jgi:predicted amidophosphoribosyltransferase